MEVVRKVKFLCFLTAEIISKRSRMVPECSQIDSASTDFQKIKVIKIATTHYICLTLEIPEIALTAPIDRGEMKTNHANHETQCQKMTPLPPSLSIMHGLCMSVHFLTSLMCAKRLRE